MIFASTSCLKGRGSKFEKDVMHVLEAYRNLKISNIELGAAHGKVPDLKPIIKYWKETNANFICHANFPPTGVNLLVNPASQSNKMQKMVMATAKSAIEFLNKVEGKLYSVHGGFVADITPSGLQMSDKVSVERARDTASNTIGQICDYAKYYDVNVAVEVEPPFDWNIMTMPSDAREMLKKVARKNLGLLFDLGHITLTEQQKGVKREEFVKLQEKAFEFHVHKVVNGVDHQKLTNDSVFRGFDKEILKKAAVTLESNSLSEKQIMESLAVISNFFG